MPWSTRPAHDGNSDLEILDPSGFAIGYGDPLYHQAVFRSDEGAQIVAKLNTADRITAEDIARILASDEVERNMPTNSPGDPRAYMEVAQLIVAALTR